MVSNELSVQHNNMTHIRTYIQLILVTMYRTTNNDCKFFYREKRKIVNDESSVDTRGVELDVDGNDIVAVRELVIACCRR